MFQPHNWSESITVLTNYYSRIICHHPEGGLNIIYSYCTYHMKGLGLAYLKFHVCSGLGFVSLELSEVIAISFESLGSLSACFPPSQIF